MGGFVVPATVGGGAAAPFGSGVFVAAEPGSSGATVDGRPSGTKLAAEPCNGDGDGGKVVDGRASGTALGAEPGEVDGMAGIGPSASMIVGEGAAGEAAGVGCSASLLTVDGCAAGVVAAGRSAALLALDASGAGGIWAAFEAVDGGDAPAMAGAFRVPSTVISILPLLVFTTTL
jgi:hypothetical protein